MTWQKEKHKLYFYQKKIKVNCFRKDAVMFSKKLKKSKSNHARGYFISLMSSFYNYTDQNILLEINPIIVSQLM